MSIKQKISNFLKPNYNSLNCGFMINPYSFAAGGAVGGWKELGRTTLGSASDSITVSSLADKRYLMVLHNTFHSGSVSERLQFNGDSGSNYARRNSWNGASDSTAVNQSFTTIHANDNLTTPTLGVHYVSNYSTKEKLIVGHSMAQNTAGAGNAPVRGESAGKWANTSNAISSISLYNDDSGDYTSGSELVVLGYDPADTHTTNFWEELASVELSSTNSVLDTGTFTAKKYLWVQTFMKQASPYTIEFQVNGNTSGYAFRYSGNGGADATGTNTSKMAGNYSALAGGMFLNGFLINNSANEKIGIFHTCEVPTTGAGTAPNRMEWAGKWANTSSQITSIQMRKEAGTGDLQSGSIIKVWGSN